MIKDGIEKMEGDGNRMRGEVKEGIQHRKLNSLFAKSLFFLLGGTSPHKQCKGVIREISLKIKR